MSTPTVAGSVRELLDLLGGICRLDGDGLVVEDAVALRGRGIHDLAWSATFSADGATVEAARWLIREASLSLGSPSASIHELYMARGRGEVSGFTVPAVNLRTQVFDMAAAMCRAAQAIEAGTVVFELARSEQEYTFQRPGEYITSVLAGCISAGWQGPVFVQGDHYQFNAKKYAADPEGTTGAIRKLTSDALRVGYGNIDIDSSTLVDLSYSTVDEQQGENYRRAAEIAALIRDEEPDGTSVSVGGEIGEVGKQNSTEEELRAYLDGFRRELDRLAGAGAVGLSKVSVQTGTSHGGVPLPGGGVAEVKLDFGTLERLSAVCREYGLAGAVQHGASTLPTAAFSRFARANAIEVHLATAFQNQIFEHAAFPADLKDEIYAYLSANHGDERMEGQTDAQFFYGARKRAFGSFKQQLWDLSVETRDRIADDLESSFSQLMQRLGVAGSGELVDQMVPRVDVPAPMPDALAATLAGEAVTVGASAEATLEEVEGE